MKRITLTVPKWLDQKVRESAHTYNRGDVSKAWITAAIEKWVPDFAKPIQPEVRNDIQEVKT
jgi:hypothetical protein